MESYTPKKEKKVVFLGDRKVGKSRFLRSLDLGEDIFEIDWELNNDILFKEEDGYTPTCGVDLRVADFEQNGKEYICNLWDIGDPKELETYSKYAYSCILFYKGGNDEYERALSYVERFKRVNPNGKVIFFRSDEMGWDTNVCRQVLIDTLA